MANILARNGRNKRFGKRRFGQNQFRIKNLGGKKKKSANGSRKSLKMVVAGE